MSKDFNATIIGCNYIPIGITNAKPKLLVNIELWTGEILIKDIYNIIEDYSSKDKITHQYAKRIGKKLLNIVISIPKDSDRLIRTFNDIFNTLVVSAVEKTN